MCCVEVCTLDYYPGYHFKVGEGRGGALHESFLHLGRGNHTTHGMERMFFFSFSTQTTGDGWEMEDGA